MIVSIGSDPNSSFSGTCISGRHCHNHNQLQLHLHNLILLFPLCPAVLTNVSHFQSSPDFHTHLCTCSQSPIQLPCIYSTVYLFPPSDCLLHLLSWRRALLLPVHAHLLGLLACLPAFWLCLSVLTDQLLTNPVLNHTLPACLWVASPLPTSLSLYRQQS